MTVKTVRRAVALSLALTMFAIPAEAGVWFRVQPAGYVPPVVQGPIATIEPGSTWAGAATLTYAPAPDAAGAYRGAQTINAIVANAAGNVQLKVPSTAAMSDGEMWVVHDAAGTTEANGYWKIQVVDATTINVCSVLLGSVGSYNCTGPTLANAYTGGGTIDFEQSAIGNFDEPSFHWVVDANNTITLAAGSGTRANIADVKFCFESSTCTTVTQQTISPNYSTQGWAITPICRKATSPGGARCGNANLYAVIEPVNGVAKVLGPLTLHLNNDATATGYTVRDVLYVDKTAGSDSYTQAQALNASASPLATVKRAMDLATSGAIVQIASETWSCTVTPGAATTLNCPGHTLASPATIKLSGIPAGLAGLDPSKIYYILPDPLPDGSASGTTFEISEKPPGQNDAAVAADQDIPKGDYAPDNTFLGAFLTGTPVATSGTGGPITMRGSLYVEPTGLAPASQNAVSQTVTVQPAPGASGTVTLTQSQRDYSALPYKTAVNKIEYRDITFDLSKFVKWSASQSPQQITFVQNRLVDPNGPTPPYGYPSTSGMSDSGTIGHMALLDSIVSAPSIASPLLLRNVKAQVSFDMMATGVAAATSQSFDNMAVFNYDALKVGDWLDNTVMSAPDPRTSVTVASISAYQPTGPCSYGCTTITVTGQTSMSATTGDLMLTVFSGTANGKRYFVNTTVPGTGTITMQGDSASQGLAVGDHVWMGHIGHADIWQQTGRAGVSNCTKPPQLNQTIQRYFARRAFTQLYTLGHPSTGLQGTLAQVTGPGGCKVGLQLTTVSTAATLDATPASYGLNTIKAGGSITVGAQTIGISAVAGNQLSFTLASAPSSPIATHIWAYNDVNNVTGNQITTTGTSGSVAGAPTGSTLKAGGVITVGGTNTGTIASVSGNTFTLAAPMSGGDVSTTTWTYALNAAWSLDPTMTVSGTTVTLASAPLGYTVQPYAMIYVSNVVNNTALAGSYARIKAVSPDQKTLTLFQPFATANGNPNFTTPEWVLTGVAKDALVQNSIWDENPAEFYHMGGGMVNWVYSGDTILANGAQVWAFEPNQFGYYPEGFMIFDSILPNVSENYRSTFSPGISLDNTQLQLGSVFGGTNMQSASATFDANYLPSGTIKKLRTQPRDPFDYVGHARAIGGNVGALN